MAINEIIHDFSLHSLEDAFSKYTEQKHYRRRGHIDYGFVYEHPVKEYADKKGHKSNILEITYRAHIKELEFQQETQKVIVPLSIKVPEHYCKAWQSIPEENEEARINSLNEFALEYSKMLDKSMKAEELRQGVSFSEESVFSKKLKDDSEEIKLRSYLLIKLEFDYARLIIGDDVSYIGMVFGEMQRSGEIRQYGYTLKEITDNILKIGGKTDATLEVQNYTPRGKFHIFMKSRGLMEKFQEQLDKIVAANKRVLEYYENLPAA